MADMRLTGLLRHLHAAPAPVTGPTDREALGAFVAHRDEAAFAALMQRHGPMVLRVCRRVLHHTQDAEDAFQATFLVLARRAASIGKAEALPGWLHGVAFRTALRARRDAGRRRAHERQAPTGVGPDPAEALAWRDVQTLLEAEIRRLPERYRAAFVLCHLEGRSRAEAAADLGLAENTVSSRLARARDRLRRRLARRGVHLSAVLAAAALSADATGSALPADFLNSTVRAATQFAARQPVTGVSGHTLQLTREAMTTMAVARMKWAVGVLAIGGLLAVGTWGAGQGPGGPPSGAGGPPAAVEAPADKPAAGERVADYAQRQRSLKNLRQIATAIINYHDATTRFPTDITDKAGKPLLSWRVELLPYLEQDNLYKSFRRDQPWDSEHNLKLLAKMPDVFRVGFEPKDATHTYYQRFTITGITWGIVLDVTGDAGAGASAPGGSASPFVGVGGPLGGGPAIGDPLAPRLGPSSTVLRFPLSIAEVTDGTSNTLGVIEAGPPVPWTKPADLAYDAKKPLPPMTGPFVNVRHAATLDGAVHPLRPKMDETTLRRLIEPNDGNFLPEWKTMNARFPADSDDEKKALAKLLEDNLTMIAALEEQLREQAALLGLANKLPKDVERAEEQAEQLKWALETVKAWNRKLRDDLGHRPGAPVPKKP